MTATATGQAPSGLVGIPPECGLLRHDFDAAVILWGRWVESYTSERNDKGELIHTLDAALAESRREARQRAAMPLEMVLAAAGGVTAPREG